MRLLVLTVVFIFAPVSYAALMIWYWPIIEAGFGFMLLVAKAQFWALAILSPIVVVMKLYEIAKARGVI